jgi:hypothetical protein
LSPQAGDNVQRTDLLFNHTIGWSLDPGPIHLFDFTLDNLPVFEGGHELADLNASVFGANVADFQADLNYYLSAVFGVSFPVLFDISTGEIDLAYSVADAFVDWPDAVAPGEVFTVDTGILPGLDGHARTVPGTPPQLSVNDDVRFDFSAGLLFDWDINAALDLDYTYRLGWGDEHGGSFDFLGLAGAQGRDQDSGHYNFSSMDAGGDFRDSDGYFELAGFSLGDQATEFTLGIFEALADATPFKKDGTYTTPEIFGSQLKIDLNHFKLFGEGFVPGSHYADPADFFSTIEAEHIPAGAFLEARLDVDDFLGAVLTKIPEPTTQAVGQVFKALDGDIDIPEFSSALLDINARAGYSLFSLDLAVGFKPATKLMFTPTQVDVALTPSWGGDTVSGRLGDSFSFTAPADLNDLGLIADFSLNGNLTAGFGVSIDPSLDVSIMSADGEIVADLSVVDFDESFQIGLYEQTFLEDYSMAYYPDLLSLDFNDISLLGNQDIAYQYDAVV